MAVGEERCADGAKMIAAQAAKQGVPVSFTEYLGLPHIFPMVLGMLPQSQLCFKEWAAACLDFCQDDSHIRKSSGKRVHLPGNRTEDVEVRDLAPLSLQEARILIETSARKRKPWTGPVSQSQL